MNLYKGVNGLVDRAKKDRQGLKGPEVEGLKWGPKDLALDPDVDHPEPQPKPVPITTLLIPFSTTNLVCDHGDHQFAIPI